MRIPSLFSTLLLLLVSTTLFAQAPSSVPKNPGLTDTWTSKDLIEPSQLAAVLNKKAGKKPLIFNIGVVEDIKGAENIGGVSKKDNLEKLSNRVKSLPRSSAIVFYCGCCPFERCPNIRPALKVFKDLGFSNAKLLNLKTNVKQDWIGKGYPMP